MKTKLCEVNAAALEKLPEHTGDKSGVGVHYVDAYIKPMNLKLPDGIPVKCKRKGLKIVLSAGGKKGEGLLRSEEHTSELQSLRHLVCRLLLEKKKHKHNTTATITTYSLRSTYIVCSAPC